MLDFMEGQRPLQLGGRGGLGRWTAFNVSDHCGLVAQMARVSRVPLRGGVAAYPLWV